MSAERLRFVEVARRANGIANVSDFGPDVTIGSGVSEPRIVVARRVRHGLWALAAEEKQA